MPSEQLTSQPRRLDGIDLLRGLAIFFVLMNHVNMRLLLAKVPYTHGIPAQLVDFLVWNGQRGVQIFFCISGFLITSITLRRWKELPQVDVRGFYLLRIARIAPLFVLLLCVLSGLDLAHVRYFVVAPKTGGLGRALLAALTLHVNVLEAHRGYLPGNWDVLWSLSVEEMFYLFFPLVCRWSRNLKVFTVVLAVLIFLGPFSRTIFSAGNETWREYSYLGAMDSIAMGCLTALLVTRWNFARRTLTTITAAGAVLVSFCLLFSAQARSLGLVKTGLDMTVLSIGACMLIAASAQSRWTAPRLLVPLSRMGQYSYEIYLTHMFVVFALFDLFLRAGSPMYLVVPFFLATMLFAFALGTLVARFYSEPINARIRRRWSRTEPVAAPVARGTTASP